MEKEVNPSQNRMSWKKYLLDIKPFTDRKLAAPESFWKLLKFWEVFEKSSVF
jgi:hypothetical protein